MDGFCVQVGEREREGISEWARMQVCNQVNQKPTCIRSTCSPSSPPSPLQEALREFRGTVIAVSHDRYFLRQIVNRVVEVKEHKLQDYSGDYSVSGAG